MPAKIFNGKTLNKGFAISFLAFLGLAFLYKFAYSPVFYINSVKFFSPLFTQGDVGTYIKYADHEIENHSFLEWFLKLDSNNLSLVYFSWIHSLLNKTGLSEILVTSLIMAFTFLTIGGILKTEERKPTYSIFSLMCSFSLLVLMQTFSKEIIILPLLYFTLWGLAKKNAKMVFFGILFLVFIRVYFAAIFIASMAMFTIYRKLGLKVFLYISLMLLLILPVLFTKILPSFTHLENVNSEFGIYTYYIQSIRYFCLFILWLPFKIAQNIAEPIIEFIKTPMPILIYQIQTLLDFLTSCTILLLAAITWYHRRVLHQASSFAKYLAMFVIFYLVVVGSLPLVHFRYMVPLVPALGILADLLKGQSPVTEFHQCSTL